MSKSSLIATFALTLLISTVLTSARVVSGGGNVGVGVRAVPSWPSSYAMKDSTIIMPCNYSGFFDAAYAAQFAIVDFDWSNAKHLWANQAPMDCEERLVTQAAMVKKFNPNAKVWVYRNLVKALPWFSSVRVKITDTQYAGWFLHFKPSPPYYVPPCTGTLCSSLYHDQEQTPHHPSECTSVCDCGTGLPCGEYLWDHRSQSLRSYLVETFILGPTGLGSPLVSGFFLDDSWTNVTASIQPWQPSIGYCDHSPIGGPTEEEYHCFEDMALTQADTTALTDAWADTLRVVHEAINAHGGFSWDQLVSISTPNLTSPNDCATFFRHACFPGVPRYETVALMHQLSWNGTLYLLQEDLATFLLVRGAYAWLGYGWVGCCEGTDPPGGGGGKAYVYANEFTLDYGTPVGQCLESGRESRVFTRTWTKSEILVDCNTGKAHIQML